MRYHWAKLDFVVAFTEEEQLKQKVEEIYVRFISVVFDPTLTRIYIQSLHSLFTVPPNYMPTSHHR